MLKLLSHSMLLLVLVSCSGGKGELGNVPNKVAVAAKSKVKNSIRVPMVKPVSFKGQSKQQILDLRKKMVATHPDLISGVYKPYNSIFGAIDDKLPWFGLAGFYGYGKGKNSVIGPAYESRFILNPCCLLMLNSGV